MRNFPITRMMDSMMRLVSVSWGCLAFGHFLNGNTAVGIGFMALCHLAAIVVAVNNR